MATKVSSLLVACLALWAPLAARPAYSAQTVSGTVIRVVDGDDVEVMDASGVLIRVRLAGIDAPEKPQPWGEEAKATLTERVQGQTVRVEVRRKEGHRGRTLGIVYLGTVNVNLWLVQEGHAWYYRGGRNDAPAALRRELQAAEREARGAEGACGPTRTQFRPPPGTTRPFSPRVSTGLESS